MGSENTAVGGRKLHYAWIVAGVTFITLLAAAGGAGDAGRDTASVRQRVSVEPG